MASVYDGDLVDVYETSVMLALANHADDGGRCFPSMSRIARLSRCSERKVRMVVRTLEERGYLRVEIGAGPKGCNVYYLSPTPAQCAPRHDVPPGTARQDPRHSVPPPPAQCAPEPSKNHQRNTRGHTRAGARASDRGGGLERMLAEKIKAGGYVPPSAVRPDQGRRMLQLGLVSEADLRGAGIQF